MSDTTKSFVDLRSDTVTRPVEGMRRAIAEAAVGDDVFGDDPTVNELERRVAELLGKEAALFVPSGTMGNLVALTSVTSPGDEMIIERSAHVFYYEVASVAAFGGVQLNTLDGDRGVMTAEQISLHIRTANLHSPGTRVIALENTHNRAGGRVYPIEEMRRIRQLADDHGVHVHLDGARLANASVASGVSLKDYADCCDTVSMCFSKGLGAPVGSAVASTAEIINTARRKRKQHGGGMRQVGILAAAALYALDHHIDRLADDHNNAARLAGFIESAPGLSLTFPVETNIVVFDVEPSLGSELELLGKLKVAGVLAVPVAPQRVRMVTHLDVDAADIDRAGEALLAVTRG